MSAQLLVPEASDHAEKAASQPYVGPKPFSRADKDLFYGRVKEAGDLLSLIVAHPVVLFYAQSGAGKSSLLNAHVLPSLVERGAEVMEVARVSGMPPDGVPLSSVGNLFAFNVLMRIEPRGALTVATLARRTIQEYLAERRATRSVADPRLRVLVIDQFEELFTYRPDRWADRSGFFDDIAMALGDDPRLRIVLAMREEFVAAVEPYLKKLPEWGRTRFRLERLSPAQALEAIVRPAEAFGREFLPKAAEKLLNNLRCSKAEDGTEALDEFVEPLQLQVVCHQLWRSLPKDATTIDDTKIKNYGNVEEALAEYYGYCINETLDACKVSEAVLRRWIEQRLITSADTRGLVFMAQETTEGMDNAVVRKLEEVYLLRPERRGGRIWYELSHDRFIGPIRDSNENWRGMRGERVVNGRYLEMAAANWAHEGRASRLLLSDALMQGAQAWLDAGGDARGMTPVLTEFLDKSKNEVHRRRLYKVVTVAVILVAFAIIIAIAFMVRQVEYHDQVKRDVQLALETERTDAAKRYLVEGREHDALVMAIKAVGDRLASGETPGKAAEEVFRRAVDRVGTDRWLLPFTGEQNTPAFSLDGSIVVTQRPDRVEVWKSESGTKLASLERTPPKSRSSGLFGFFTGFQRAIPLNNKTVLMTTGSDLSLWDVDRNQAIDVRIPRFESSGESPIPIWFTASYDGKYVGVRGLFVEAGRESISPAWKAMVLVSTFDGHRLFEVENASQVWFSRARPEAFVRFQDEKGDAIRKVELEPKARVSLELRYPKESFERASLSSDGSSMIVVMKRGVTWIFDTSSGKHAALPAVSSREGGWVAVSSSDAGVVARVNLEIEAEANDVNVDVWVRAGNRKLAMRLPFAITDVAISEDGHDLALLGRRADGTSVVERYVVDLAGTSAMLWSPKALGSFTAFPSRPVAVEKMWRTWFRDGAFTALNLASGESRSVTLPDAKAAVASTGVSDVAYTDERGRTRIRPMGERSAFVPSTDLGEVFGNACGIMARNPIAPKEALAYCDQFRRRNSASSAQPSP